MYLSRLGTLLPFALAMLSCINVQAQKRVIEVDDLPNFRRISHQNISEDGKWVYIVTEDYNSDADKNGVFAEYSGETVLKLYSSKGKEAFVSENVSRARMLSSSPFLLYTNKISKRQRDSLLLVRQNMKDEKRKKKDDMPMDILHLLLLQDKTQTCREVFTADSLRTIKFSSDTDIFAFQSGRKDSTLYLMKADRELARFGSVHSYVLGNDGTLCYTDSSGLKSYKSSEPVSIYHASKKEKIESITISQDGRRIAFTAKKNKDKSARLMLSCDGRPAEEISSLPTSDRQDLVLPEKSSISFSESSARLFFTLSAMEREKDTLMLASNRADLEIWNYRDPQLYTVQNVKLPSDNKKTYLCVHDINTSKTLLLQDKKMHIRLPGNKDGRWALASYDEDYLIPSLWEGSHAADYYALDMTTGNKYPLSKKDFSDIGLTYSGDHAYAYNVQDSTWYSFDMAMQKRTVLATPKALASWDEEDDHPYFPPAYGFAGVTDNEEAILLYDRYDIFLAKLDGTVLKRLTPDGREKKLIYRLMRLESAKELRKGATISLDKTQYLLATDEATHSTAYYSANFQKGITKRLYGGEFKLSSLKKAEHTDNVIFSYSTYEKYPEIRISDLSFRKELCLTHEGEQEKDFKWGYAKSIRWTSYKGKELEGMLFFPEDFDPSKKYPMIVNFYERYSNTLYEHRLPMPQRSSPDYHLFNSKGYIIFNPDVRYTDGHPGESCYDCVMSGIDKVLEMGFVDEDRIGAGGHSWGGFQTAYLATRTDRFKAIESGAAVVNMFSAYGGIRWASGRARSFQYEMGQSRLGTTMWEHPEIYAENSPLLNLDKVKTPILILQNDADGHVPWYQGIEFFVAMRRLQKPCWMLNYRNEPHWPVKLANRLDFNRRLEQFFSHFLKGEEAPKWMTEGVRAVDKPYEMGY